jgi:hypothetical protein
MKGWIYVITNKAMPGLVKVGYSMKDPVLRAEELEHTGSPYPYVVDYEVLVEEPFGIEQKVHSHLKKYHERKEWFHCTSEDAIAAIQSVVGNGALIENFKRADRERVIAIRQQEEAVEKVRKAVEEEQQKRKAEIEEKKQDIYNQYALLLKTASGFPYKILCKILWIFSSIALLLYIFTVPVYLLSTTERVIAGIWLFFNLGLIILTETDIIWVSEQSLEYKMLIAERDKRVEEIENFASQPQSKEK